MVPEEEEPSAELERLTWFGVELVEHAQNDKAQTTTNNRLIVLLRICISILDLFRKTCRATPNGISGCPNDSAIKVR